MNEATAISVAMTNRSAVADCVVQAVITANAEEPLLILLLHLMRQPGRVLALGSDAKWTGIVLTVSDALGGASSHAIVVASALELAIAATDVIDDLIDGDWDANLESPARALNASLALTCLAQRVLLKLNHPRAPALACCLADGILSACSGEDLDIIFEDAADVSEEQALAMTERKAGSLVALACRLGAMLSIDDAELIDQVATFGRYIGIIVQLLNDLAAVDPTAVERGSDLRRRKKTLPIAYALRCAREEEFPDVLAWTTKEEAPTDEQFLARLHELGALHFTWAVAETYRRRALVLLDELSSWIGKEQTVELARLVPAVEFR